MKLYTIITIMIRLAGEPHLHFTHVDFGSVVTVLKISAIGEVIC